MTRTSFTFVRPTMGTRNVLVPATSRRGAAAGVSLITRSRWYAVAAQWALWGVARSLGPRAIPGRPATWDPPWGRHAWATLQPALPGFDELAVYTRPQASRTGMAALLLRRGVAVGFLKLRSDAGELDREERALRAFPQGTVGTFRVPQVLDRGSVSGMHWMLLTAMPPRPAAPASRTAVGPVLDELQDHLAAVLPRDPGTPGHWRPMHGDLTAWNLRRIGRGLPWLIDWEDASWAPPAADLVYYRATHLAVFGHVPPGTVAPDAAEHEEAAEFWLGRVGLRSDTDHDADFTKHLLTTLRARSATS